LGLLSNAAESEGLARSIPDNGGVYLVPALSGLGAPHWRPDAQGAISGLSFSTSKAHVARAALESMAYQVNDLKSAFEADDIRWGELRIDGGMSANDWMAQDLADILGITLERPDVVESTGLGAAILAATGAGLYDSLGDAVKAMRGDTSRFTPDIDAKVRKARLAGWQNALAHILN
jgi:glycerol kinase